jgi:hypothetical protein
MAIGKNPRHKRIRQRVHINAKTLKSIESNPSFKARLAKVSAIPIDRSYDIPYLAGYSKDGKRVYFDRHFNFKFAGKDISKYIRLHEVIEKSLLDIFKFKYQEAHKYATHFERQAVEAAGIDWDKYCDHIDPYIKAVAREQLVKVPKDLDLEPYQDEHEKKILQSLSKVIKEEVVNEVKISLEYHDELNQLLWNGIKLKTEVRNKLLSFAYSWAAFAKIPRDMIQDIYMLGGNANYNYTPLSDIDVHIVIDRNAFAKGASREMIDEYLQDKKLLWTLTHKIKIYGISLEPYAHHSEDGFASHQGVYSLARGEWVQFPNRGSYDFKNDKALKRKVIFYKRSIDEIIKNKMGTDAVKEFKRKIREMRGAAISRGGEFSFENLVFKELRNRGYLDKLNKYEQSLKDQALSLK